MNHIRVCTTLSAKYDIDGADYYKYEIETIIDTPNWCTEIRQIDREGHVSDYMANHSKILYPYLLEAMQKPRIDMAAMGFRNEIKESALKEHKTIVRLLMG